MSVDRFIELRVVTNRTKFSDLFRDFMVGFWVEHPDFPISSLTEDDIDDFDFLDYANFEALKPILDNRERKGYSNYLSFMVESLDESILMSSTREENPFIGSTLHYELSFSLGVGK